MRIIYFVPTFLCFHALVGCTEHNRVGSDSSTSSSSGSTTTAKTETNSSTVTDDSVNEPVQIAGAFLTCSIQDDIYCGLRDSNNQKVALPQGSVSFNATLASSAKNLVNDESVPSSSSSWYWRITAAANSAIATNNFANLQALELLINGKSVGSGGLVMNLTVPPTVCSQPGGASIATVTFQNNCNFPVNFTWISYACEVDTYGINTQPTATYVPTGQDQPRIGDRWYVLRTSSGNVVEEWDVRNDPGQPFTYKTCQP